MDRINELICNIYELGIIRRDIENWKWTIDDVEVIKNISTRLLLITNDDEVGFDNLLGMKFEDVRSLLVRKHFEYLRMFRNELREVCSNE